MIQTRTSDLKLDRNKDHLKYYTMLFIAFLQGIFKENEEGQFKWSPDLEKTEILISDQDTILPDKYLPRIVTVRGPSAPLILYFNDENERNHQTGTEKRTQIIQSSITFHCIAKTGIEAQQLADNIYRSINIYYKTLQQWGLHKIMRNPQISPETPANSVFSPEVISEGRLVMITYTFFYRWTYTNTRSDLPAATSLKFYLNSALGNGELKDVKVANPQHPGVSFNQPEASQPLQDPTFINNSKI